MRGKYRSVKTSFSEILILKGWSDRKLREVMDKVLISTEAFFRSIS